MLRHSDLIFATLELLVIQTPLAFAELAPGLYVVENLHPEFYVRDTYPTAISADGSKVVGTSITHYSPTSEAFLWDSGTLIGMGDLPGEFQTPFGELSSRANDITPDGQIVVGQGNGMLGSEAVYWDSGGGPYPIGDLPGGLHDSEARGVSENMTIVGAGTSSFGFEAFVWNGTMSGLGDLPGGEFNSVANDVSTDASVIVGTGHSASGQEAFIYRNGAMTGLGDLPGGAFRSAANGVSADGTTVVGQGRSGTFNRDEAFIWRDGVMTGLGYLPDGGNSSAAFAASRDGTVVVGTATGQTAPYGLNNKAMIWDETNGMRALEDVLIDELGLELDGIVLGYAFAISDDGQTIAGVGTDFDSLDEETSIAFVVRLPEPSTLVVFSLSAVVVLLKHRRVRNRRLG